MKGRQASAPDLPARLEALADAVELADGRLDGDAIAFARQVEIKARERLRHGTAHTLVALLGATGSGKSSVANALIGSEIATTGVRRPTTSSTLAFVYGNDDAGELLDWLGVENRHLVAQRDELAGLVVLDVPDHDSVAVSHRLEMERIAELADLLLWVSDHEKYADKAMHGYLQTLARHGAVMVMVLNKTDQLSAEDTAAMLEDLQRLMAHDGIAQPTILAVSATTDAGMDQLVNRLTVAVAEQRVMLDRLSADVDVAADELLALVGSGSAALDPKVEKQLVADLASGSGMHVVADAIASGYRRDAASRTGWPFTRWLGRLRPHPLRKLHLGPGSGGRTSLPAPSGAQVARVNAAVRNAADSVSADLPVIWATRIREAATPEERVLRDHLDTAVADAVRLHRTQPPRWWSVVGALQLTLAAGVVVGALWLMALAAMAYLQLPAIPTPAVQRIPLPTGLLVLGALAGWLLALLSRRLASLGARRRAAQARRDVGKEIEKVAQELIFQPLRQELIDRQELVSRLTAASRQ